jgi:hypothetical protein
MQDTLNKPAWEGNACQVRCFGGPEPLSDQAPASSMIRFLLRFIGLCLLATAFVFFVYDGTKSIANHQLLYTKVSEFWAILDQNSLNFVQDWLKRRLAWAWDPYLQKSFDLPAWVLVGIVAAILILLGRKKKPLIGYARD